MSAHLQGLDWRVWEIYEDPTYEVLAHRVTPEQVERHNANNRACSVLFLSLSLMDFERFLISPLLEISG